MAQLRYREKKLGAGGRQKNNGRGKKSDTMTIF